MAAWTLLQRIKCSGTGECAGVVRGSPNEVSNPLKVLLTIQAHSLTNYKPSQTQEKMSRRRGRGVLLFTLGWQGGSTCGVNLSIVDYRRLTLCRLAFRSHFSHLMINEYIIC